MYTIAQKYVWYLHVLLKKEASPSIYADCVNGGSFYKPNSKSLGKFG